MKRWILAWMFVGMPVVAGTLAVDTVTTPVKILERADDYRGAWDSFLLVTKISNFKRDRLDDESQFEVYIQGRTKSFVKFLNPRDKGRSLLMLEDDMWIYIPSSGRPIRITPLQRLTGNVSNGDLARTNYSGDYDPVLLREESIEGKECYVLELTAKRKGATYPKIHYWVSKSDFSPRKAEFFLTSGKNHKAASFESFGEFNGKRLLTRQIIFDKIRRDEKSVMEFVRYQPQAIPEKYFNKNSMGTN